MNALQQIERAAQEQGLRFIVIGGFAVVEHGYTRVTADFDLLVSRGDEQKWRMLLENLGYKLTQDGDTFLQYANEEATAWPVDLMFVQPGTFSGLIAAAHPAKVQGAEPLIVSLEHLLALKLHVLKQGRLHRFLKDFQDVVELLRINKLDLRSDRMRDLFLRYGTTDLYEKVQRAVQS